MNKHLFCLAFLLPFFLSAQRLEHHDILLLNLSKTASGILQASQPRFLTTFNPRGYNNQPRFFSDTELWLTSQTPDDTTQTDLFALDLSAKTLARITATALTSEYSPTLMPSGKRFSAVRVEEDGNQRLWSFPLDRSDNGQPEFPRLLNVGYHCWLNDTLIAFFIVGDNNAPHTLQVASIRNQAPRRIASNIGRCLLRQPDGKLLFVQKATSETWFLKSWNPANNTQDIIVKMPQGTEDFALMPDGFFLAGNGSRLYSYQAGRDADWKELNNLAKFGVKKITRLAAARDGKVAVVVE